MKNLLLLLLLANILYFLWGLYEREETQPGVAIFAESELGPPMKVSARRSVESAANVGAAIGSGSSSEFSAVVGRSCVTIGPFKVQADAESAEFDFSDRGMKTSVRSTQAETFVGHWVQIRNVADNATAKKMLSRLNEGGLTDAYLVRTDDEGLKISLGLFGDIEGAEKIELQARSLELPAEIKPRTADRTVYFVDVALPPGQGAGSIVDRYGEEQVLLRDAARCPR